MYRNKLKKERAKRKQKSQIDKKNWGPEKFALPPKRS